MRGRFGGEVVRMARIGDRVRYSGDGFDLTFDPADVAAHRSAAKRSRRSTSPGCADAAAPRRDRRARSDQLRQRGAARRERVKRGEAFVKSCQGRRQVSSRIVKFCQGSSRLPLTRR